VNANNVVALHFMALKNMEEVISYGEAT